MHDSLTKKGGYELVSLKSYAGILLNQSSIMNVIFNWTRYSLICPSSSSMIC